MGNPMTTLYERIGGTAAVKAAVDIFYGKVLLDDRIRHFFDGVDMGVREGVGQHDRQTAGAGAEF